MWKLVVCLWNVLMRSVKEYVEWVMDCGLQLSKKANTAYQKGGCSVAAINSNSSCI